ncbi:MAG: lycopene cyclase domain-containing protein [Cyclobacteriaceae bacterium]|nr:lycopene cyclase domain-containing protein [Cyclobacteriaceae bacterium]MCX7636785.1 lycopene cyclase domain-containing protein [Cyclobacteriaceae bacterium]MDW8331324.1 lycopene cyclase domain-containing protein [Cyclobacteriaceae bacterium]
MNEKYLYLTLDLASISIPLAFSFYPKAPFYKTWKYLWPAILIPALIFIIWDEAFTRMGVWGFNPRYLTGIYVFSLPIEEILFFICIPYACVFTYFALNYLIEKDYLFPHQEFISFAIVIALFITGIYHLEKWYTATTFLGLSALLALHLHFIRPRFMGRFYFAYAVILIPFFIVNGILTGSWIDEQVVWYNDAENLGMRMGTIPFEDTFYGMLLIWMNVALYEYLKEGNR